MTPRRCPHGRLRDKWSECAYCDQHPRTEADDVAWFDRTGCCGGCGQPGTWCQCTDARPCGCRGLHEMGSGIGVDPTDLFADAGPVEVSADQGELFP